MKFGQRVTINKNEPSEVSGYYSGTAVVENRAIDGTETMYIITVDPEYQGYVRPISGKDYFIKMVVAHPDNVTLEDTADYGDY